MPSASASRRPSASHLRTVDLADRIHSAAIHLLRRLRREDAAAGLPAPQLSALSVIVFGGPLTLGELARAEQVRPPTISKLIVELEAQGLVEREVDASDRRVVRVRATARGTKVLHDGRQRRVSALVASLGALSAHDRALLARAVPVLEKVARTAAEE
ncbi:MAG: MarR family transcriptional regulator [Gemmatimonadota bacterium]